MPQYSTKLSGWNAMIGIGVLLAIFAVRLATFHDQKGDENLVRQINIELMSDFYPQQVENLKAALASDNKDYVSQETKDIISSRIEIQSVQTSYPLFNYSSPRIVIIKVKFFIKNDSGSGDVKTNYYKFKYGVIGNNWQYIYRSNVISYYLNFF